MAEAETDLHERQSQDPMDTLRHTTSHVMAQAVAQLFPGTKFAIGPSIADGFYYDFELPEAIGQDDLKRIEKQMRKIIAAKIPLEHIEVPRDEAIRRMQEADQPYKVELIEAIESPTVTFYQQGDFIDLCRGPHLETTGGVKAFKLLSVAGAYWRGNEHNTMLTRIYGTAFPTKPELHEHL